MSWLTKNKLEYNFHDYKTQGISKTKLEEWISIAGIDSIFNKRSTTWRELPSTEQNKAASQSGAIALMMLHNSIIKRPIIEVGKKLLVGYNEKEYRSLLT